MLAVGAASAQSCDTPFGPVMRDTDSVRQALAQLRDPDGRVVHELWARLGAGLAHKRSDDPTRPWNEAAHAFGWAGPWAG